MDKIYPEELIWLPKSTEHKHDGHCTVLTVRRLDHCVNLSVSSDLKYLNTPELI